MTNSEARKRRIEQTRDRILAPHVCHGKSHPDCDNECRDGCCLGHPVLTHPVGDVDMVNKPAHHASHPKGIECFDVIEDNPYYLIGAAMKYLWRVSWGGKDDDVQDIRKAIAHLEREVQRRTRTT